MSVVSGTGRRRRPVSKVMAAAVVIVAIGVAAASAAATGLLSGVTGGGSAEGKNTPPPSTAKVDRQTLIDTQTQSGQLGYGDATAVAGQLGGILTWLPAVGSSITRGQAVYRVGNTPVLLLYGPLPTYRDLSVGTKGDDVKQFEQNLAALGYGGFTVDDTYSATTAAAVKKWQADLGLEKTGAVELGRVFYADGAVRIDSRTSAIGASAQPGQEVLRYTGSARVITVELNVSARRLAVTDAAVGVVLPDGRKVPGKIVKTATVVKPAEGQQAASTKIAVTVTVDDDKVLAGLDQATIDVAFTASQRENVLTVPVAALLALAEGGYGVQIAEGSATRLVAVKTGMFAAGRVEISGDGIAEGTVVGMPS